MTVLERRAGGLLRITILVTIAAGCGSRPLAPGTPAPGVPIAATDDAADACALLAAPGDPVTSVGLTHAVDPARAPYPANDSERLLFRQLYETLVARDCNGMPRPRLAAAWQRHADGRTWVVTLRGDARFTDGAPVTAAGVVASWSGGNGAGALRPEVRRLVDSVAVLGDRTLAVTMRDETAESPLALAHTDLSIVRRLPGAAWPLGTRGARVEPDAGGRPGADVTVSWASDAAVDAVDAARSVRFVVAPGRDPRDFLDQGVDLLVTRDPTTLDYAATVPHVERVPLDWLRTYVLVSPLRQPVSPMLSPAARQALAGAVRGVARGADGPFWWETVTECEIAAPAARTPPRSGRIVYRAGDEVSRDLADRLVALARIPGAGGRDLVSALLPGLPAQPGLRAVGVSGELAAEDLARGPDAGYILPLERHPVHACGALRALTDAWRWLDPATIAPLVDTRLEAVVRVGRSGIGVDGDGVLVLAHPRPGPREGTP